MRRNCNLELRLAPICDPVEYDNCQYQEEEQNPNLVKDGTKQNQQPVTIFYDGKVCVSDVTETQARTILMLASRETEDKLIRTPTGSEPTSPTTPSPVCTPTTRHSVKRSLERFLQERKHRIQATTPYGHLTRT